MQKLKWPILVTVLLTTFVFISFYLILRINRPTLEGSLALAGLASPVTVIRDIYAIPHIFAENPGDLFFSQGFVTAQDRLWQMDLTRRIALGRLSEIFGMETVEMDYFFRALELGELSQKIYGYLDDETKGELSAFSDGVNRYIDSGKRPTESIILRYNIEPWHPTDTISIHLLSALDLSLNMDEEIFMYKALTSLGEEKAKVFFNWLGEKLPEGSQKMREGMKIDSDFLDGYRIAKERFGLFSGYGASNGWVVDGTKSVSGKPMLANDPHLRIQVPSVWYEVHLKAPGINVIGATFPGTPYVLIGHNERVAWGFTDSMADRVDLFIEKLSPDATRYWFRDHWEDIEKKRLEIRVKDNSGYKTVVRESHYTIHGPIINSFRGGLEDILSMRWSAREVPDLTLTGLSRLNRSGNVEELISGAKYGKIYAQNMIFADVDGSIGYQLVGGIPKRLKGNGKFPVPGWSGEYEWSGFIPEKDLPFSINPPSHFIVAANNKLTADGFPYLISNSYASPYRSERIIALLHEKDVLSARDFGEMQADVYSLQARLFVQSIKGIETDDPYVKWALEELSGWNFQVSRNSRPALLYEVIRAHLLRLIFEDELGEVFPGFLHNLEFNYEFVNEVIADGSAAWWDNVDSEETETRKDIVLTGINQAVADIKQKLGRKGSNWTWGALLKYKFQHPLGNIRILSYIFNPSPIPAAGDRETINNSYFSYDGRPFQLTRIPSYRVIVDLSDMDSAMSMNSTGQSGDPLSRFYSDDIRKWAGVGYKTLFFKEESIDRNSWKKLWLVPESGLD